MVLQKKYHQRWKQEKEINSYVQYRAISNAFRKDGEPYNELWESQDQEVNEKYLEEIEDERRELFGDEWALLFSEGRE